MKRAIVLIASATVAAVLSSCCSSDNSSARIDALEKRVEALEQAQKAMPSKPAKPEWVRIQQVKARARMKEDAKNYSSDDLRIIETLYQVANSKWETEEAKESLKTLVSKYAKANRTGCAILYLGQMSKGQEQMDYLKKAISDFSDCYYGDGVQVGAYARYYLANAYLAAGDNDSADKLFNEIRAQYPDAVTHDGEKLLVVIDRDNAAKQAK